MAGELQILDERMEQEFLSLPTPLAFIDFESIINSDYVIPGTRMSEAIPCQWSCHTLTDHGLDWEGRLYHDEFLWTGDIGWSPIYAFVQSLYDATYDASTILIYSPYEIRCLETCKQLAQNDIDAWNSGMIREDYVVVDYSGEKVPLTNELVGEICAMCDSMLSRIYDMCPRGYTKGGVTAWLQSSSFEGSHSIKHLLPAANAEYSRTSELLISEGLPANGYSGLSGIHNGSECMTAYSNALNRPPRADAEVWESGNAPFDPVIEDQCLTYCKLDTLAMVIVYLAVLEATETWRETADVDPAEFCSINGSELFHSIETDGDNHVFYTTCDYNFETPYDYDTEIEWFYDSEIQNLPIREMYSYLCPECRKARNQAR